MKITTIIFCFTIILFGCNEAKNNNENNNSNLPKQCQEASVTIDSLVIDQFNSSNIDILKRYFIGNGRWEFRQKAERVYAIRKEKKDGVFPTESLGYYSHNVDSSGIYKTRVIVSFDRYSGSDVSNDITTFATLKDKHINTAPLMDYSGRGMASYLVIKGKSINIEIWEEANVCERIFTNRAIKELNEELLGILKHQSEIKLTGTMSLSEFYPPKIDSTFFNIIDGEMQGIYIVQAGLRTNCEGEVYIKAFDTKYNNRLSETELIKKTTTPIGWSNDGKTVFPYEREFMLFEGNGADDYQARFEIWFRDKFGSEKKLAETTKSVYGWEN
jgi:hypothetical protein